MSGYEINLNGRTALVTGGSRGIGRACCVMLAEAGAAKIGIHYRDNESAAEETADLVEAHGAEAILLQADLGDPEKCEMIVDGFAETAGRLDILVANAGIWTEAGLEDLTEDVLEETWAVNVDGVIHCCRAAAPYMIAREWGRMILIASTAGQRGEAFHAHYAASKGALLAFTKSIAQELAPGNVLVNAVAPGWVETGMTEPSLAGPALETILSEIPRGRVACPEDIAGPVLFLCSDLSEHLVGSTISVNGGSVLI
jgi:3-oxoacyl-[acyl-carrier protein] reductase